MNTEIDSANSIYLGDSVYATKRDYDIILTTGSHLELEADSVIYLDTEVTEALIKFYADKTR